MQLSAYLAVFRSRRILFLLPIAVAGLLALWTTLAAPTRYRSTMTLWSERPGGSSSWISGSLTPAGQDQQLLSELLSTRYFQRIVAGASPLGSYVEKHRVEGWGPTALVARLRPAPPLDERVAAALTHVEAVARSAHVLEVRYDAPSPRLGTRTLDVVVQQFIKRRGAFQQDALADAERAVNAASATLSGARTNLTHYLETHPGSTTTNDPQLRGLATTERIAVSTLATATAAVNDAAASLSAGSSQTTLRVVDPPHLVGPTSGTKRDLTALVAGLFAGTLVSAFGVVAVAKLESKREPGAAAAGLPAAPGETGRQEHDEPGAPIAPGPTRKPRARSAPSGEAEEARASPSGAAKAKTPSARKTSGTTSSSRKNTSSSRKTTGMKRSPRKKIAAEEPAAAAPELATAELASGAPTEGADGP